MSQINYQYAFLEEYLPVRYSANEFQKQCRSDVYSFKAGYCPLHIKNGLCERISRIAVVPTSDWVVLFIPASKSERTFNRYSYLASYIEQKTGIVSTIEAIANTYDFESMHGSKKRIDHSDTYCIDSEYFNGKNVILIDDVITTGKSFHNVADRLMRKGASSITGLFVAKTVHPVESFAETTYHREYKNDGWSYGKEYGAVECFR